MKYESLTQIQADNLFTSVTYWPTSKKFDVKIWNDATNETVVASGDTEVSTIVKALIMWNAGVK